jgi:PhnB protein
MPIRKLNPYLNFDGTAGKALALYEKALGAKTLNVQRFGDAPPMPGSPPLSAADKKRVLHASIELGGGYIMMSDTPPGVAVTAGDNNHISLDFTDVKEMQKAFSALGKGGKVTMPIAKQFWGAHFGMLTDAYGIRWMMNCEE